MTPRDPCMGFWLTWAGILVVLAALAGVLVGVL